MKDRRPPETGPDVVLDPQSLRALAHPLRVRLLSELREHGVATASRLAERVGVSSGLTSYHLRQLAAAGFLVEEPERRRGRERWWRAAHHRTSFDTETIGPDDRAAGVEYLRAVAGGYAHRMLRFVESLPASAGPGDVWDRVWNLSDWSLVLSDDDARELRARVYDVIEEFRQRQAPPANGGRPFTLQAQLFPVDDVVDAT